MEKDSEIYRGKKERVKSIALKAKKESSDDETLTSGSDDEEYAMAKGKSDWKCFRCGDPNHLIGDCPKLPRNKDQKAFIGGSWSDSENDTEDKTNNETCLMAQSSNEVCLRTCLEPDEWIKDSGCSKHMTSNKSLFSTYKAYDGGNIMDGVDIEDLTIEQYLELTQNHAPSVGIKVDDMTIAKYLEYEEIIKTQDYDKYQPYSAKSNALQSPIHPKITKTLSKYTKENEVIKKREQSDHGLGDWFEAELEKCWKIQQKRDNGHLNLRRQARDDALRNWEAQIDQLRRQEHEVSECKMVYTSKNDAHQKETSQIERISSLPEKPNQGSLTIPYSDDIFNINAIADLGASVNVMSESILEELSLAEP
ncbi:copia protein [Tanacetum coccineum]